MKILQAIFSKLAISFCRSASKSEYFISFFSILEGPTVLNSVASFLIVSQAIKIYLPESLLR